LGVIIQWGGCYDIEGKLERAPVVVIKTNFTCYHLKEPSEKYKPFFKPILKKVNLVSEVIKFINRNPKSSWKKMIQQVFFFFDYFFSFNPQLFKIVNENILFL